LTQTTTINLLVGTPPTATIDDSVTFDAVVPLGNQDQTIAIANAENSVPLTYTAAAYASTDGSCSGDIAWLSVPVTSGTLEGGESGGVAVVVTPASASLAPGNYAAEVCIDTNDPAHAAVVVPVNMTVVQGPTSDTLFFSGFESGETGTVTTGVFTFNVDQPAEDDQAGSALDLGLVGLAQTLALEYGGRNIRCNVVLPGFLETRMTAQLPPARREEVRAEHALGRFNTAENAARFIATLAKLDHVSGQVFTLDSRIDRWT